MQGKSKDFGDFGAKLNAKNLTIHELKFMNPRPKLNAKKISKSQEFLQPKLNVKDILYIFYTFSTFLFQFCYDGGNQNLIRGGK